MVVSTNNFVLDNLPFHKSTETIKFTQLLNENCSLSDYVQVFEYDVVNHQTQFDLSFGFLPKDILKHGSPFHLIQRDSEKLGKILSAYLKTWLPLGGAKPSIKTIWFEFDARNYIPAFFISFRPSSFRQAIHELSTIEHFSDFSLNITRKQRVEQWLQVASSSIFIEDIGILFSRKNEVRWCFRGAKKDDLYLLDKLVGLTIDHKFLAPFLSLIPEVKVSFDAHLESSRVGIEFKLHTEECLAKRKEFMKLFFNTCKTSVNEEAYNMGHWLDVSNRSKIFHLKDGKNIKKDISHVKLIFENGYFQTGKIYYQFQQKTITNYEIN